MAIIKMGVINGCFSDQQSDFAVDYGILFPTIANSFKTINWEPYLGLYGKKLSEKQTEHRETLLRRYWAYFGCKKKGV